MPTFRGKNLRSGDLAEQLGLLLMQNLALVAAVPRTEDVGIDAVVTLLEDFDSNRFKASNGFYVQLKSSSVSHIEFIKEQVNWLFELELPFFVAGVDRKTCRIELYCCHALHEAFVLDSKRAKLRLEFGSGIDVLDFIPCGEVVNVGPPVFSWSMEDIHSKTDLRSSFNAVCKAHIEFYKQSAEWRRVGQVVTVRWRENEVPEQRGYKSMYRDIDGPVESAADIAIPYFVRLLDLCVSFGDDYLLSEIHLLTQRSRLRRYRMKAHESSPDATSLVVPDEFKFILERQAEDEKFTAQLLAQYKRQSEEENDDF